jgi:hypothetical protein
MNTEKIEKLKKSLSNNLLPADLKPKIEAEIKRLEDLDAKQPKQAVKNAKQSKTTKPKRTAMSLAKEIRKEGESWSDARARASKMMKEKSHTATKDVETELSKLAEGGYLTDPTFGNFQNQVLAKGGSISSKQLDLGYQYSFNKDEDNVGSLYKEGGVYSVIGFENGKHFSESFEKFADAKKFYLDKKGKVKMANGGGVEQANRLDEIIKRRIEIDDFLNKKYGKSRGRNKNEKLEIASLRAEYNALSDEWNELSKYANGGGVGDDVIVIYVDNYPYYLKKMGDTTHFRMSNSMSGVDIVIPSHIGQHRGESYYEDVRSWLKGGANPNEKKYMSNNRYDNGGNINDKTKKMRKQKLKKGDTVTIYGKRWFDRVNGNTYHTAEVEVNGTTLGKSPMTYGYDEQYLQTGKEILLKHYDLPIGMTERSPMWQLRDYGVTLTKYVSDGLKRDLAKGGGVTFKNGREYPTGRNWTNDHRHTNKSDDHEVKYTRKKKFELGGTMATDLAGHTGGGTGGLNAGMPLDGFSNTAYTGLVGETGAMSSGEMFMAGGTLPSGAEQSYMITESFGNPAQHFDKGGGVTFKNGREYPTGRNWTNDHRHTNKSDDHEVKYTRKKLMAGGSFAGGGGVNDINYDDVLEVLKDKLEGATEELPREYEFASDYKGEEVEKQSRDGFIAFTDGGYEVTWFENMSYFTGGGYSLPTKPLDDEMQRQVDYNYQLAKETFIENYPEIVEELGEDNIDYNSLYEAGYGSEAEELSEMEMNYDGDDTILCEIGAYYYDTDNYRGIDEKHTVRLYGLVNLESPYHRRGNLDDSYDIDITFDSISELKEKVDAGLKEIIDWFDGKYYNDSTTEMKIRRMADGGMNNLTIQDVSFAKGGKVSPFKNMMETNTITEKEINLIKNRMNNDKVDEDTQEAIDYIWENSPQLTPDQNKKGIDFLRNLWKSPTGKERTNNPFGYREQEALENFEYFELRGFYDAGNRYRKFYVPLYTCVGADSNFEYAFYNGEVNILG